MRLLNPSHLKYNDIGRNQLFLTEEEEQTLTTQYREERKKLRQYILARKKCVQYFLNKYKETLASGKSVAKLSADYNPRKAGLNKQIEEKFKRELSDSRIRTWGRVDWILRGLNLSDDVLDEMATQLKPSAKLQEIRDEIAKIENTLFCSMLMATQELAKKYASNLLGIDEADAGQQAGMYMLESIRRYDPDYRTPGGQRVKLLTYSYGRAENLLKEWILANSRLVRIPRSKMERILIVVKAYDELPADRINIVDLTDGANEILKTRKAESNKKPEAKDEFTVDEIDGLVKMLMSSYIHLDAPYRRHLQSGFTIGDMLSDQQPSAIETIEKQDDKEQLIELMQDNLEDLEFQIIMLRWFHDPTDKVPKALTDVSNLLVSEYGGTQYSRESIRLIEKSAIAKLRDVEEVQELWSQ